MQKVSTIAHAMHPVYRVCLHDMQVCFWCICICACKTSVYMYMFVYMVCMCGIHVYTCTCMLCMYSGYRDSVVKLIMEVGEVELVVCCGG